MDYNSRAISDPYEKTPVVISSRVDFGYELCDRLGIGAFHVFEQSGHRVQTDENKSSIYLLLIL